MLSSYVRAETLRTKPKPIECITYLSILGSLEPRLGGCFRETKPRKVRRDDVEARVVLTPRRQKRKHLPHFEEVSRP